jgi:hypothetical protein
MKVYKGGSFVFRFYRISSYFLFAVEITIVFYLFIEKFNNFWTIISILVTLLPIHIGLCNVSKPPQFTIRKIPNRLGYSIKIKLEVFNKINKNIIIKFLGNRKIFLSAGDNASNCVVEHNSVNNIIIYTLKIRQDVAKKIIHLKYLHVDALYQMQDSNKIYRKKIYFLNPLYESYLTLNQIRNLKNNFFNQFRTYLNSLVNFNKG